MTNVERFPKSAPSQIALTHPPAEAMPIGLLDWKPIRKNSLRGYAKILLGRALMMSDVPVNVAANGRAWASLPSKPIVTDGRHATDAAGKLRYQALLEWTSDSARNRFSNSVVRAVLEQYPHALDDPS